MSTNCKDCKFFNITSDFDGPCTNPAFHKHVKHLTKVVLTGVLKVELTAAEFIVGSLRVNENFGCIHFEKQIDEVKSD